MTFDFLAEFSISSRAPMGMTMQYRQFENYIDSSIRAKNFNDGNFIKKGKKVVKLPA